MKVFQGWTNALRLMGPAFLVSVAYLDPGNWATAIEGGSRFGYDLVWVVVLSNLIAILLQTLAARLGLVTGKHLAQHCRHEYPPLVSVLLWMLCEVSIVALDLTMVIGTAVGLNLLFRLPLLQCILLSGLDSLLLLMMVPSLGLRRGELVTVGLILVVVCCFLWDLVLSKPPITEVLGGLWPRLSRDSLYTAVSLLGANVMPHNFYLHSALVSGQASQIGHGGCSVSDLCRYNLIDISAALGIALLVNVAVMLVAAAAFNSVGITVSTLQDAHDVMEQLLSSSIAPAVFGMALLCAGQLSTFTGTISGQVVLKGFMNIKLTVWVRRLLTRSAAILPAAIVQIMYGSAAIYQMLLIAQVVLALQLPFTLVPLIKITSSPRHMGAFANSRVTQAAAWGAAVIIFAANLLLCMELIWPTPSVAPASAPLSWAAAVMGSLEDLARGGSLPLAAAYLACVVATAAGLSLLLWMIITPLRDDPKAMPQPQALPLHAYEWWDEPVPRTPSPQSQSLEEGRGPPGAAWQHLTQAHHRPAGGPSSPPSAECPGAPHPLPGEAPDSWEELVDIVTDPPEAPLGSVASSPLASRWAPPGEGPPSKAAGQAVPGGPWPVCEVSIREDLPRSSRKLCAQIIDEFWSGLYDLHGAPTKPAVQPRGGSWQPPRQGQSTTNRQVQEHRDGDLERVRQCLESLCLKGASSLLRRYCRETVLSRFEIYACEVRASASRVDPIWHCHLSSFGIWCVLRMLQLMQVEPRPEMWGRYSSVLNRLQGIVSGRRLDLPRIDYELACALLVYVEIAQRHVVDQLGQAGTAAGNTAFPKGKEIALSVLKRYRRHLSLPRGP